MKLDLPELGGPIIDIFNRIFLPIFIMLDISGYVRIDIYN